MVLGEEVVAVSSEVWRLLEEYDVPAAIARVFRVHVETTRTSSKQVKVTLRGRNARQVAAMIADPPRMLDVPKEVVFWLATKGPNGLRVKDIRKRTSTLIQKSRDTKSVLLVGPSEATLAEKSILEGLHVKRRQIQKSVRCWLTIPEKGAIDARSLALDRKFDTCISMSKLSDNDPAYVVDLAVVGEREESVNAVLALIDELHIKRLQIPQAVYGWLSNASKGASCARATDLERKFGICIHVGPPSDDDPASVVDMTVVGEREESVNDVLAIIDGLHVKHMHIPRAVYYWLVNTSRGANCAREMDLERKFDTCISMGEPSDDGEPACVVDVAVVGDCEQNVDEVLAIIDGLHAKHVQIPLAVYYWLTNKSRGASCAREMDLERKFDTCISMREPSDGDPASLVDLAVVGEREESVNDVLAVIDGLHVKHGQIPQAVHGWLVHASKGAETTRSLELHRKFDAYISMASLSDDKDPARMMAFAVVGESEENVDQVFATVENIAVQQVGITKLQAEFWMGHDDEQSRTRPNHKLEDSTNTYIGYDEGESCMHVAGRPENVKEAVKELNKRQYIVPRTSVISFAMANYVARARRPHENNNHQVHLVYNAVQPGTWKLRRLYVVASQGDEAEADKADDDLLQKLDLAEIVLEVPAWSQFLVRQCHELEKTTETGISFSTDALSGRVIVTIAGSSSTVKQGMTEVIRRVEGHAKYREGDICLRGIRGQSVDSAGFEKAADAKPLNLSSCREPFDWERLTRDRWCYTGRSRDGRPPKRTRQPSV